MRGMTTLFLLGVGVLVACAYGSREASGQAASQEEALLAQLQLSAAKPVHLVINRSDGQFYVLGDTQPSLPVGDPHETRNWYWRQEDGVGCVYVEFDHDQQGGGWTKGCAPGSFIIKLLTSGPNVVDVLGPGLQDAQDPNITPDPTRVWYFTQNSPGCIYVPHFGGTIKICD